MSTEWMLVARINDGEGSLTIERVRSLPETELSSLDEAQRILASLTSASPYQRAVDAHAIAVEAFEGLRADTTEHEAARQERALQALQRAVAAMTSVPDELARLASDVTGTDGDVAGVASAVERLRSGAEWQTLREVAEDRAARLMWADAGGGPEVLAVNGESRLRIQLLLAVVMQGLAVITAEVLVASTDAIAAASRVVRGLEAEVLFGRATLAGFPIGDATEHAGKMQFRELPVDVMAAAQGALRRARVLLAAAGDPPQPETGQGDMADPARDGGAATKAPTATGDESEHPAGAAAPPAAPGEAADTASATRPPVDLYRVAQHLAETLTAVEEAYGELPRMEEMFDAVERDSDAYGSLFRQVGLSVRRMGEALTAAGIQPVRVNLPPTSDDIAALTLDDPSPQVRLRQQMLAELLVGEAALAELESLRQPTEVRIGPGGVVASARFDPAAPGRVRGWMLQTGRMAEHSAEAAAAATGADAHPDGDAEQDWLARAAVTCLAHGLHEAALLYLAALTAASASGGEEAEAPDAPTRELAEATLSRFAAGDTRNASAVAISLIRAMSQAIRVTTPAGVADVPAHDTPDAAPPPGDTTSPAGKP
jgi:hypothetical protein